MPRSGTNFLHRLLCQHPDCGAINTTPVREDYLLHHAESLHRYVRRLKWQWGHWGADWEFVAPLANNTGRGLTDFLRSLSDANRIVTKTPSVANVNLFDTFLPHAYLVLIIRDGRSVIASGMSGFEWNFETATREWAQAARSILALSKKDANIEQRRTMTRYETLNNDTENELKRILDFLQLDTAVYDFNAALETPVYGSSYQKEEGDKLTWQPREKSESFGKEERWSSWSRAQHQRFNWIAGKEMEALGYDLLHTDRPGSPIKHRLLDLLYAARRIPRLFLNSVKSGIKAFVEAWKGKNQQKTNLKF